MFSVYAIRNLIYVCLLISYSVALLSPIHINSISKCSSSFHKSATEELQTNEALDNAEPEHDRPEKKTDWKMTYMTLKFVYYSRKRLII